MGAGNQAWQQIPTEERYPMALHGVSARFNWLRKASGLSHRRIATLVSQRLTVSGADVRCDVAYFAVSSGTLNALANGTHGYHHRTLGVLEVFFETPQGYLRVADEPAAAFYKPEPEQAPEHGLDDDVWLMATRISDLDADGRAAVNQIIELIRSQTPRPTAADDTGPHGGAELGR